jgi:hypothetical protein
MLEAAARALHKLLIVSRWKRNPLRLVAECSPPSVPDPVVATRGAFVGVAAQRLDAASANIIARAALHMSARRTWWRLESVFTLPDAIDTNPIAHTAPTSA